MSNEQSQIEPSLMAAKRIEELENGMEVANARLSAAGQMIGEINQANVELRAATLLWQSRYEKLAGQKAKEIETLNKRIAENAGNSPDAARAEMDRLNRVIGAMDAEIARLIASLKEKEAELNAFFQEAADDCLALENDGA